MLCHFVVSQRIILFHQKDTFIMAKIRKAKNVCGPLCGDNYYVTFFIFLVTTLCIFVGLVYTFVHRSRNPTNRGVKSVRQNAHSRMVAKEQSSFAKRRQQSIGWRAANSEHRHKQR